MPLQTEPKTKLKLSLPVRLAAPLQEYCFDRVTQRPGYGCVSDFVTKAVEERMERLGIHTLADAARLRKENPPT